MLGTTSRDTRNQPCRLVQFIFLSFITLRHYCTCIKTTPPIREQNNVTLYTTMCSVAFMFTIVIIIDMYIIQEHGVKVNIILNACGDDGTILFIGQCSAKVTVHCDDQVSYLRCALKTMLGELLQIQNTTTAIVTDIHKFRLRIIIEN